MFVQLLPYQARVAGLVLVLDYFLVGRDRCQDHGRFNFVSISSLEFRGLKSSTELG